MVIASKLQSTTDRSLLGKLGEQYVAEYLTKNSFRILAYNYACRAGEIDIIAYKDSVLAFVEVKLRTKHYFSMSTVVTLSKQRKIITTAKRYLMENGYSHNVILRFDVALVEPDNIHEPLIYIPNAFTDQDKSW